MQRSSRRFVISFLFVLCAVGAFADGIVIRRAARTSAPSGVLPEAFSPVINAACSEVEPNEQPSNASPISVGSTCSGYASATDASSVQIDYGSMKDGIEDLFVLNLPSNMRLNIDLIWSDTHADLDLFLFRMNGSTLDVVDGSTMNGSMPESITTGTLTAGTYYIGVSAFSGGSNYNLKVSQATSSAACVEDTNTACLQSNRFRLRASFDTGTQSGDAGAVALTADTAYFWFFGNNNVEMVVKVLDACSFNNRFWVFAGGLTNVGVTLTVFDTQANVTKTYTNERGKAFVPLQDTDAFSTCSAVPCTYSLSPSPQNFSTGGGAGTLTMTAGSGCSWTASSQAQWVTINGGATGSGNGTISFSVAANSGASRSTTITAGGQTATITQSGSTPSCAYVLTPGSSSVGSGGASGSISVSTTAGCAWTAASNALWITLTGVTSGSGSGAVAYTVAPNSGSARIGTMTIAGQTVTISQAGAAPASYDGTWTGTTSQGKSISITVVSNAVTTITMGWHATGGCTVDGTTTTTFTPPRALSGNTFSLTISGTVAITLNGSFSSTSAGNGTFSLTFNQPFPSCTATGSGSFTISK